MQVPTKFNSNTLVDWFCGELVHLYTYSVSQHSKELHWYICAPPQKPQNLSSHLFVCIVGKGC